MPAASCPIESKILNSDFEPVADSLCRLSSEVGEIGSALAIFHRGDLVVDIHAGHKDLKCREPWDDRTLASLFSASKALVALCLLHLIDRGAAKLEDPVVKHWPGFTAGDPRKSDVTLTHVLRHRSALPALRNNRPGDILNWRAMTQALEQAPMLWPAGTKTAYHAVTFGHLVGEIVRRISGLMPSEYFAFNFAQALNADVFLRHNSSLDSRTAESDGMDWKTRVACAVMVHFAPRLGGWRQQFFRPCMTYYHPNNPAWRNSEIPAIGGFGTAVGLAKVFAMLAEGGKLDGNEVLSPSMCERIAEIGRDSPAQIEQAMKFPARIGLGLFFNEGPAANFGPNPMSFGHTGMGGTTIFCDPSNRLAFAYVSNHLASPSRNNESLVGDRALRLIDAAYSCLK